MRRSGRCEKLVWESLSIRLTLYVLVAPATFAAGCFQIRECAVIDAERCTRVQRAEERAGIEQVDGHQGGGRVARLEARKGLGGDGAVEVVPACGGAVLACAYGAKEDGGHGEGEIRVGHDYRS
jgi:hypothetical protein